MTIGSRIQLALLLVGMLPLTLTALISYHRARQMLDENAVRHLGSVAALQEERLRAQTFQNLERLRLVSSHTQLRLSLSRFDDTRSDFELDTLGRILGDAMGSIDDIRSISIASMGGTILVSTDPKRVGRRVADDAFFVSGLKSEQAALWTRGEDGLPCSLLSGPLRLDGKTIGVVAIEAAATELLKVAANRDGMGESGETLVIGHLVESGDSALYLAPSRFDPAAALTRPASETAAASLSGSTQVISRAKDYRGQDVLSVARTIPEARLGLVTKIDLSEIFSPARKLQSVTIALIAINAAALLVASYIVARSIIRPVRSLAATAGQITSGDHSCRSSEATRNEPGEFGVLARSIDLLAERLTGINHELEARVAERTTELARSNRDLEQFAYIASHDLKEPLRMVTSYVQLLERRYGDKLDDEAHEFIGFAVEGVTRMRDLISDLLAYSRIGTRGESMAAIDPRGSLDAALKVLALSIDESGAQIDVGDLPSVRGDPGQIALLFQNLIANAIKFTPPGSAPQIEITATAPRVGKPTFEVRDHGIGIAPEYREVIFQIFKRLNRREEHEGTGIGLAICQRIVERHGGSIWVEAGEGAGTRFKFTLNPGAPEGVAP